MNKFVVDNDKEYVVSEVMGEAPLKPLLTFPIPLKESGPISLTLYLNKSLMRASDGMKELDTFTFGVKLTEGRQPKGF